MRTQSSATAKRISEPCILVVTLDQVLSYKATQSHRIVRFLNRIRLVAIGPRCDWSAMFATISSSGRMVALSRTIRENRWQEPSKEIVRLVVAVNDWCTTNRDGRRPKVRSIDRCILRPIVRAIVILRELVASCDLAYDQSWHPKTDGTINRCDLWPIIRSIVAPNDLEPPVCSFELDHRTCYDWFCPADHPRPLRSVVRSFYDLPTVPTCRSLSDRKPGVTGA